MNCQEALRYAPASPLLEPPPSGPIRPRPRPRETKPRSTTQPPRRICRASALRSHIPSSTHCPPPPLRRRPLVYPFQILLDLFHSPDHESLDDCPWLLRPKQSSSTYPTTKATTPTIHHPVCRARQTIVRARRPAAALPTLCRGGGSDVGSIGRDVTSHRGPGLSTKEACRPEQERGKKRDSGNDHRVVTWIRPLQFEIGLKPTLNLVVGAFSTLNLAAPPPRFLSVSTPVTSCLPTATRPRRPATTRVTL